MFKYPYGIGSTVGSGVATEGSGEASESIEGDGVTEDPKPSGEGDGVGSTVASGDGVGETVGSTVGSGVGLTEGGPWELGLTEGGPWELGRSYLSMKPLSLAYLANLLWQ